ncbi:hypothetical protein ACA29_09850 [Lederbergia galactosidilytica]|uniref:Uncharacterized protein n=1 Tax=Lederbergia galactosidilytica TaxID=217031 RepID=A0A0Q9YAL7_9BACI|nr:hypothetical protein ACA29_09850 [Lederbergia galactosidilytica]
MERRAATPARTARAEDPGLSAAREAAEAVPRARRKRPLAAEINLSSFISILKEKKRKKTVGKHQNQNSWCLSTV